MPGMNAVAHPGHDPLRFDFCGLDFGSPIVLLSGCVGFGEEYTRIEGFSNRDAGAIVLKGTTQNPRLGNPPHRIFETPAGMLNAIGLQNPGVDHVVRRILPELDFSETRFIANVSGSTIEEYVEVTRRFDQSPDRCDRNQHLVSQRQGRRMSRSATIRTCPRKSSQACRRATTKPIITKLSPNQTDIRENARRCIEAGSDALAVINTVMGMAIDVSYTPPRHRQHPGRPVGPGDQADRTAESAPGVRGGARAITCPSSARAASPTQPMRWSSSSQAHRPWVSARRCSTTRWSARRSTRASPTICAPRA